MVVDEASGGIAQIPDGWKGKREGDRGAVQYRNLSDPSQQWAGRRRLQKMGQGMARCWQSVEWTVVPDIKLYRILFFFTFFKNYMNDDDTVKNCDWAGEAILVDNNPELRQGDIIKFNNPKTHWEGIGIIVTADCDIAKGKHGGIISYVPTLKLHDYWRLFTLPKKIEKAEEGFLKQMYSGVKSAWKKKNGESEISNDAIDAMVLSSDDDQIFKLVGIDDGAKDKWSRIFSAYRKAVSRDSDISLDAMIDLILELKNSISGTNGDPESALKDIELSVGSLPGDAFFMSRIPNEKGEGYVAYLRLVRELNVMQIALIPKDLQRPEVTVKRIAKLKSPFLYRLTQQLAQVFSDIGLPEEYENNRLDVAKIIKSAVIHKTLNRVEA